MRRLLLIATAFGCACGTPAQRSKRFVLEPLRPGQAAPMSPARDHVFNDPGPAAEDLRRLSALLAELGLDSDPNAEAELFREKTDSASADWTRTALDAYMRREDLQAVLFAQAAVGGDPGNETRRKLLAALARRSSIAADPQGLLPLPDLVDHELLLAETAFFDKSFGAAAQHCRRALLLAPGHSKAWQRLGSALYAVGETEQAREAYLRALKEDPKDAQLREFLLEKGWDQQQ